MKQRGYDENSGGATAAAASGSMGSSDGAW